MNTIKFPMPPLVRMPKNKRLHVLTRKQSINQFRSVPKPLLCCV